MNRFQSDFETSLSRSPDTWRILMRCWRTLDTFSVLSWVFIIGTQLNWLSQYLSYNYDVRKSFNDVLKDNTLHHVQSFEVF